MLLLSLLLAAGPAQALELELGAQLAMVKDLPDLGAADPPAELGFGPALLVPVKLSLWEQGPWLRAELGMTTSLGWGRVTNLLLMGQQDGVPQDMRSSAGWLSLGPELHVPMPEGSPVSPYFGASVGGAVVGSRVRLDGASDEPPVVTRQLRPRVGGQVGLQLQILDNVAFAIEAGYSVCRIPERVVSGREDLQRDAYGLNPYTLGVSFSLPLL